MSVTLDKKLLIEATRQALAALRDEPPNWLTESRRLSYQGLIKMLEAPTSKTPSRPTSSSCSGTPTSKRCSAWR
jgi:hypothetical protein